VNPYLIAKFAACLNLSIAPTPPEADAENNSDIVDLPDGFTYEIGEKYPAVDVVIRPVDLSVLENVYQLYSSLQKLRLQNSCLQRVPKSK